MQKDQQSVQPIQSSFSKMWSWALGHKARLIWAITALLVLTDKLTGVVGVYNFLSNPKAVMEALAITDHALFPLVSTAALFVFVWFLISRAVRMDDANALKQRAIVQDASRAMSTTVDQRLAEFEPKLKYLFDVLECEGEQRRLETSYQKIHERKLEMQKEMKSWNYEIPEFPENISMNQMSAEQNRGDVLSRLKVPELLSGTGVQISEDLDGLADEIPTDYDRLLALDPDLAGVYKRGYNALLIADADIRRQMGENKSRLQKAKAEIYGDDPHG